MTVVPSGRHARPFTYDEQFQGRVFYDEPLARHTTFRIGGPAQCYIEVESISALGRVLRDCHRLGTPWFLIGKGSNLLVSDHGYAGVAVNLVGDFKSWEYDEERHIFTVGSGATLARVVQDAFRRGVSGMEFAVGTPGTVGGALRMNAGTRTNWIGSRVVSATTFHPVRGLKRYDGSEIAWGYRSSGFAEDEVIVECELAVEEGAEPFIRGRMDGALARRKRTQPLGLPSCGSVFRNPEDNSAGDLIESVGLKGHRQGGAQISDIHANFIVNLDHATARDVLILMHLAYEKVREAYGIELQPEVRFVGFE